MLTFLFLALMACEPLPIVTEEYDELVILQVTGNQYRRVIFLRNDRVMATRLLLDDMTWTSCGDRFCLQWQDYLNCERVIVFKRLVMAEMEYDPFVIRGPWWMQGMRDLKQP